MSLARKHSIILCSIWFVIFFSFCFVFISYGVESFSTIASKGGRFAIGSIILPGYLISFFLFQRARKGRKEGQMDERDKIIETKASEVSLIILMLVVYGTCIGLYESYRGAEAVPVGWLYFMAYGSIALVSFLQPAISLVIDYGGMTDG